MEVIPVINCHDKDFECVLAKIAVAEKFLKKGPPSRDAAARFAEAPARRARQGDWLHLDACDGRFALNKSWRNPTQWANLRSEFNLEVHLMVEEPEKQIEGWIAAGAKRLIVHAETLNEETAKHIIAHAKRLGIGTMLSSVPHTTFSRLWPLLKMFSEFQVLAVDPGPAGQKFLLSALTKIRFLRNFAPNAKIEVDGGINPETAREAKTAGANVVVSGTYIFGSKNPEKAFKELRKI